MCFDTVDVAFCVRPTNTRILKGVGKKRSVCERSKTVAVTRAPQEVTLPQTSDIPKWAGGGPLSDIVNFIIGIEPVYALMQTAARNVLKKSALKKGVDWEAEVARLSREIPEEERASALARNTNPAVKYPSYYIQKFHAYDEGNLNWLASFEQESATYSMALRCYRYVDGLTPDIAMNMLRDTYLDAVFENVPDSFLPEKDQSFFVVDAGCGVGLSSEAIANRLDSISPNAQVDVLGIDASPYFLAVAEHRQKSVNINNHRIEYIHAFAEDTKLAAESCNWYSMQYVIHEMPASVIASVFQEAWRVLKPGGVFSICDNNPQSDTIQNLPPVLFTLMKSTEPHSDSYYRLDVAKLLKQIGFVSVLTVPSDHRHRTVVAVKP